MKVRQKPSSNRTGGASSGTSSSVLAPALAAVLLWSTVATAFELALRQMSVSQLMAGAGLFSVMCLGLLLAVQGKLGDALRGLRHGWPRALRQGLLGPVLYYLLLFGAYERLPAQVAQPVNYTWALTLSLVSAVVLKHELSLRDWGGLVLGYLGVVVISSASQTLQGTLDVLGLSLAVGSTLLWTAYWLLAARDQRPPVVASFQNFLAALPFLLLWMLVTDGLFSSNTRSSWLGMAYVGTFEMGVTFVLWQTALKRSAHVGRTSTLIFLSPFLSLAFIHFVLGEPLLPRTFLGLTLIVFGVAMQRISKKSASA